MMNSKITKKLIIYFLIVIFFYSIVSGLLFLNLGKKNLEESSTLYLENRAERVASFISNVLEVSEEEDQPRVNKNPMGKSSNQRQMRHSPSQNYLKWMNELLETDIRIVNKEEKYIESGIDKDPIDYESLNSSEQAIVNEAFNGVISSTKESSFFNNETSISVAAPIVINGQVISVLLLNENNYLPTEFLDSARFIFIISTLIGGILVTALAVYFANRFIQPLNKLNLTTKKMIRGDYKVSTGIEQEDEIGDLATCVDTLANRLEKARLESEEMNQMKDDFISSMSHELKTPVTVIKSSLEALKDGVVSKEEEVKYYHEILYDEIGILERLINDLMDLNILKNSKFRMKKEEINILDVLNDGIRSQTPLARDKNISIEKDFSENIFMYLGDYTRLRQLFITIINNGIKYSEENSKIEIKERKEKDKFLISISNNGPKIPKETLDHIFEPFYRDRNTKKKGFGLGLAIAKEIASHHNIEILVDSKEEITKFTLEFPLKVEVKNEM